MGIRNTFGGAVLAVGMLAVPVSACAQDSPTHSQSQRTEITHVAANDIVSAPTVIDSTISVNVRDMRDDERFSTNSIVALAMRMSNNDSARGQAILVYFGSNEDELNELRVGASEANNVPDGRYPVAGIMQAEPDQDYPAGTYMVMLHGQDMVNSENFNTDGIDSFGVRTLVMIAHQNARSILMAQRTNPSPS